MAPTMERPAPTKKSLRIWVRNNGHVMRKKTRASYVYPRTVEAAKDPFECATGKNKMFYLIAINLFPDTKIVRPDDSDSEAENEETNQTDEESKTEEPSSNSESELTKIDKNRKRARRSPTVETSSDSSSTPSPRSLSSSPPASSQSSPDKDLAARPVVVARTRRVIRANSTSAENSKSTSRRQRLLPLKKTGVKTNPANLENKEACSTVSDCENCLSSPDSSVMIGESAKHSPPSKAAKGYSHDLTAAKGGTVPSNRKLPPIPTIMSSLNKIIETCSATGVVSFSLAKKKPRQSRS